MSDIDDLSIDSQKQIVSELDRYCICPISLEKTKKMAMFNNRLYDKNTINKWILEQKCKNYCKADSNYKGWKHTNKLLDPVSREALKYKYAIKSLYHTELQRDHFLWVLSNRFPKINANNVDDFLPKVVPVTKDYIFNRDVITINDFVTNVNSMMQEHDLVPHEYTDNDDDDTKEVIVGIDVDDSSTTSNELSNTTEKDTNEMPQVETNNTVTHEMPTFKNNPRPTSRRKLQSIPSFKKNEYGKGIVLSILSQAKKDGYANSLLHGK